MHVDHFAALCHNRDRLPTVTLWRQSERKKGVIINAGVLQEQFEFALTAVAQEVQAILHAPT